MVAQDKVVLNDELLEAIAQLPRPLVFTNGCFDILHRGHTTYLEQARQLGGSLVVAVNSDESVKRQNKGTDRPLNNVDDRLAVLAALECIDVVVSFNDDTPEKIIRRVRPDVLVKGGDWPINTIVGADFVQENGGTVYSIPFKFERSTTALVDKIRGVSA